MLQKSVTLISDSLSERQGPQATKTDIDIDADNPNTFIEYDTDHD